MKTAWSTLPADSAMVMDTQKKTEPGELDACFSEASAGPGRWENCYLLLPAESVAGGGGNLLRNASMWT